MERNAYEEGYSDGCVVARTRGGNRGAEWNADARNLTGDDRADYIAGFNAALDDSAPDTLPKAQDAR